MQKKYPIFLKSIGLLIGLTTFVVSLWRLPQLQVQSLPPGEKHIELENSSRATLAQMLGGFFVLLGLYFTWRNLSIAEEKQITERFTKAIELLGSQEQDIRIGGIYALERIAKDSPKDHWVIIEVLTSFVREKSSRIDKETKSRIPKYDVEIQAILTVLGRRDLQHECLQNQRLDLTNSNLAGFSFHPKSDFTGANFSKTILTGASLKGVVLKNADLNDANISGVDAREADLREAHMNSANLNYAKLSRAKLGKVHLNKAFLYQVDFREANLEEADLSCAHIKGSTFGGADFKNATFKGTIFYDNEDWDKRDWTVDDHAQQEMMDSEIARQDREESGIYQPDYDDFYYEEYRPRKADFRGARNLTTDQIELAKEIANAIYDDTIRRSLGLPEYKSLEIELLNAWLESLTPL